MEPLNNDSNWVKTISIENDKFLINRKYIQFFMKMYLQWSKDDSSTSYSRKLIILRLPIFDKMVLSQFQLYIEAQTMTQCFVGRNLKFLFSFDLLKAKRIFFVSYTC